MLVRCVLPQSYYIYINLSEGVESVGRQMRGDRIRRLFGDFSAENATKSGRVWRKVPESESSVALRPQRPYGLLI